MVQFHCIGWWDKCLPLLLKSGFLSSIRHLGAVTGSETMQPLQAVLFCFVNCSD